MRYPLSHADRLWILALRYQIWDGSEVRNPLALGSGAILYPYISIQLKGLHLSCSEDIFMHEFFLFIYLSSLKSITEPDNLTA